MECQFATTAAKDLELTAAKDLELTSATVELQLAKLTAKLAKLKAKGEKDPSNWGYAGDLHKVEFDLADILAFINYSSTAMTAKKTAFTKYIVTQLENDAILAVGDCHVMLRVSETETYSNLHEMVDGALVPRYTELLDAALAFAKEVKPVAAFNPTLVAHAFLEQLREDIGEDNFREVVRKQKKTPIAGVYHFHDYCDANMTMDAAMASVGIVALPDRVVDLWNAAWDHAKTRIEAMTL